MTMTLIGLDKLIRNFFNNPIYLPRKKAHKTRIRPIVPSTNLIYV